MGVSLALQHCRNIVPRSAKKLVADTDFVLYSVLVFKKGFDYVKSLFRSHKFTVRSFNYNSQAVQEYNSKRVVMKESLQTHYINLVNFAKATFSEVFTSWTTIKAMRVFVEAVLRFGLQDNGQPTSTLVCLVQPRQGFETKIRKVLEMEYSALGTGGSGGEDDAKHAGAGMGEEFYPYVSVNIDLSVD